MVNRLIAGLLFGVALFSSAAQYPNRAQATRTTVTVNVVWLPDFATANQVCGMLGQPAPTGTILACYHPASNTIYAVQPTSFNDEFHLTILGHEFWHALGAEHP